MQGRDELRREAWRWQWCYLIYAVLRKELIKAAFEENPSSPVRGPAKVDGGKSQPGFFDYCRGHTLF